MESSLKKILLVSLVSSAFYLPAFVPNAHAFIDTLFKIGTKISGNALPDPVVDVKSFAKNIADGVAQVVAQRMVDEIVKSTITWMNEGFDGNPAFVTDPEKYFKDIANGAVGEYINGTKLGFLCSPFQAQIKLSLVKQYVDKSPAYQCTLSEIGVNYDDFVDNFQQGGWRAFVAVSQTEGGNPYGAYVSAKLDLDSEIANQLALKTEEQRNNLGFQSYRTCAARNPDAATLQQLFDDVADGRRTSESVKQQYPGIDFGKPGGACTKEGPIKTPGSVVKSQLDRVLPSGLEKLVSVEHVEQLVSAFSAALLDRYVFGPQGLLGDDHDDIFDDSNRPAGETSISWIFCADENEFCSFTGTRLVKYGTEGDYILLELTDGTDCTNEIFGDPDPGAAKKCEYLGTGGVSSDPSGGNLSCSPSVTLASSEELVIWSIESAYPEGTTYQWSEDGINIEPTDSPTELSITYPTPGRKTASITATPPGSGAITVSCNPSVLISNTGAREIE